MKNLNRFFVAAVLGLISAFGQSFTFENSSTTLPIIIQAGTEVALESGIDFTSEEVEVGHPVDFFVRNNVTVNGKVVISAGTIATGEITRVEKAQQACRNCENKCASMQVIVKSVQAVDGQNIKLRATPINIKASKPGFPAELNIGQRVNASVLNNTTVQL